MPIHEVIANTLRKRFQDQIEIPCEVAVQYDNIKFKIPADKIWVRFKVIEGESNQKSIGGITNIFRIIGMATAEVFLPLDEGDQESRTLCDTIAGAFQSVTDGAVVLKTPSVKPVGLTKNGWKINVICPFYADVTE